MAKLASGKTREKVEGGWQYYDKSTDSIKFISDAEYRKKVQTQLDNYKDEVTRLEQLLLEIP